MRAATEQRELMEVAVQVGTAAATIPGAAQKIHVERLRERALRDASAKGAAPGDWMRQMAAAFPSAVTRDVEPVH